MNILIVGSGGREHALAWKLQQSPKVEKLFCAPGNAGIGEVAELVPIKAEDLVGLLKFARTSKIDLTVVGPEVPLTLGIVDLFEKDGMRVFGPTKLAAEIEGSKVFAKQFMRKYKIPTAEFRIFDATQRYDAERYIDEVPAPIVLKADGLAAGKGAVVCETKEKALEVLHEMMVQKVFGEAGERVVIEECMVGEEASLLAVTDGVQFVILPAAQDHKRILDGDRGKNTGGMGAYAPTPFITEKILEKIKRSIIKPTLNGLSKEGRLYRGCLYCGLMFTQTGPKVIEFNCRFGDPETQAILPLLEGDFADLLLASASGTLQNFKAKQRPATAVCVVIASGGYPDKYEVGKEILGLDGLAGFEDVVIFHAGTKRDHGKVVTSGGRVLGVTAIGPGENFEATISRAYQAVTKITFDGAYYRSDIGAKALRAVETT
ncbi:MAG: phosphoribosylamine--glycine ligase [Bacteroidota bacterium]